MNFNQVRSELKQAGTAQNRKVYRRHGVREKMYGVSYATLGKLAKKIKTDHPLAEKLWATGNHDCQVLATMVADPAAVTSRQLDDWLRDLDSYVITDAFASFVAKTPFARRKAEKWTRSRREFVGQAGYNLLAAIAGSGDDLPASYFVEHLKTIEAKIHRSPNRVRHAMNVALISIGVRSPGLTRRAVAAAKRIGRVEVDHGETSCKTPAAIPYIEKTLAHRAARE